MGLTANVGRNVMGGRLLSEKHVDPPIRNVGVTWLITWGAKSTMVIRNLVKESRDKDGEDWFEPTLNIHKGFPSLPPHFICPSSTEWPKKKNS